MAVKQVVEVICDRCSKVIEGATPPGDTKTQPLLYIEGLMVNQHSEVHFSDLCAKCITRVSALLSQVRLDEGKPGDDEKPIVGDTTPAASIKKPITKDADKASAKT